MSRTFGLGATGWVRALWAWWLVVALSGLVFIAVSFFFSSMYELKNQQTELMPKAEQLRGLFDPLRRQQLDVPLQLLNDFNAGRLTAEALGDARLRAEPYFKLYELDDHGAMALAGDRGDAPPAWVAPLARAQAGQPGELTTIRPLPGHAAPAGTPESYLLAVARDGHGHWLVAQTDLDYIFGPWLQQRVAALKLGMGTHIRVMTSQKTWDSDHAPSGSNFHFGANVNGHQASGEWTAAEKPSGDPERVRVSGHSRILGQSATESAWTLEVPTFFPDDPYPFQRVAIDLDSYPRLDGVKQIYGWILLAGILVMGSFALSIHFAGRTVRRELALANARANFTAMVSHELKTPVAAIRLYGEILVNKLVDEPVKIDEYHQIIMDESARLQRLIENLLDLGKIERGARTYELAPFEANALVEEAIAQALAATPSDKPYHLARELATDLPPIRADRDAARQAIANLVHNALKYGGNPPDVTVVTRRVGDAVLVEVLDRGPGIPVARRQAIFEPYVRLEDEARRETQGTGLGLALVKGYMEGQGGRVAVDERAGGGSAFQLHFPLAG